MYKYPEIEPQIDVEEATIRAVRHLGCSEDGASFDDIERYVSPFFGGKNNWESIQSCLDSAVGKGIMSKLSNGKYKFNKPQDASLNLDSPDAGNVGTVSVEEDIQGTDLDTGPSYVGNVRTAEENTNIPLPLDDDQNSVEKSLKTGE